MDANSPADELSAAWWLIDAGCRGFQAAPQRARTYGGAPATTPNVAMEQSWQDLGNRASERARVAFARARELSVRLAEMRQGEHQHQAVFDRAAEGAGMALERAQAAVQQAAWAHHRAAELHRRAAAMWDRQG